MMNNPGCSFSAPQFWNPVFFNSPRNNFFNAGLIDFGLVPNNSLVPGLIVSGHSVLSQQFLSRGERKDYAAIATKTEEYRRVRRVSSLRGGRRVKQDT